MEPEKRDYHKEAEDFYMEKLNGQKDPKELYGDFHLPADVPSGIIGFEVYLPEEPLARSTKDLKKQKEETKIMGNRKVTFMSGGLNPNRLNQLIERALESKKHQFGSSVEGSKVLIASCFFPHSFSGMDNFVVSGVDTPINYTLFSRYPYCSAIFIHSPWALTCIRNPYAKYPLTEAKINEFRNLLINSQKKE